MAYSKLISCIAGTFLIALPAGAATFTTYADEASFLAATGPLSSEDFNSFVSDVSFDGSSFDVGDFSLSADPTGVRNIIDALPEELNSAAIDGTTFVSTFVDASSMTITFDSAINAFGLDLLNFGNVNDNRAMTILGETIETGSTGNSLVYIGVISDMAFTSVTFSNNKNDGFSLDNFSYGTVSAVPLPASLPMLLAGLGLFGWIRRRS